MFVLSHCLDCTLFQDSSLKDLWWTLMQAASTFYSEKIKARTGGVIVFVTQHCVWLGPLKGHLMFSYTPCLSSTIFAWSYLSLQQEKVLPAVKLLNWYRLHFSVESFFLLCHVKRGGEGGGKEIKCDPSALTDSLPFQIWKIIILLHNAWKNGSEQILNTLERFVPTK